MALSPAQEPRAHSGRRIWSENSSSNSVGRISLLYGTSILLVVIGEFSGLTLYLMNIVVALLWVSQISVFFKNSSFRKFRVAVLGALFSLAAYGWFRGNFVSFWLLDLNILMLFVLTGSTSNQFDVPRKLERLANMIARWLVVIIPLAIAMAITVGLRPGDLETRFVTSSDDGAFIINVVANLLVPAIYVAPLFSHLNSTVRFTIPIAIALYGAFGILTASRGAFIASIIGMIGLMFFSGLGRSQRLRRGKQLASVCVLLSCLAIVVFYGRAEMGNNMRLIASRLTETEGMSGGRVEEQNDLLETFSLRAFVFGSGLGSAKENLTDTKTLNGVPMVHFGYLHLMLKGGLILLILLYGIILIGIWRCQAMGLVGQPVGYMLMLFLVTDNMHTQWHAPLAVGLMCLALSFALASAHPRRGRIS